MVHKCHVTPVGLVVSTGRLARFPHGYPLSATVCFQPGDVLGVRVDLAKNDVRFYLNGVHWPVRADRAVGPVESTVKESVSDLKIYPYFGQLLGCVLRLLPGEK
eukprot:Colp12_sorted_trinity150504_noHs@15286